MIKALLGIVGSVAATALVIALVCACILSGRCDDDKR